MSPVAKSTADLVGSVGTQVFSRGGYQRGPLLPPCSLPHTCVLRFGPRTPLDGDSVHLKLAALRTHSLPLYWPLLSRDDRASDLAGIRPTI
jgi:hypothetical protein